LTPEVFYLKLIVRQTGEFRFAQPQGAWRTVAIGIVRSWILQISNADQINKKKEERKVSQP
jgi:hypothetical protein